jgi:glucose-6-phosphate-specific signal transduction histidine kinase
MPKKESAGFLKETKEPFNIPKKHKEYQSEINELTSNSRRLLEQHEIILNNIGRELHDQTGQTLTVIKLLLEKVKNNNSQKRNDEINDIIQQVSLLISELSNLSIELNPPISRGLDLVSAINGLMDRIEKVYHLHAYIKYIGSFENIPYLLKITIYRFIQEILKNMVNQNVIKNIDIILKSNNCNLKLIILIEGTNFNLFEESNEQKVIYIQNTIKLQNGKLVIKNLKNNGMNISLRFPLLSGI